MKIPITKELEHELYGTRLLVFLETEPQSNKYRQVILDAAEFKRFAMTIGTVTGKNGGLEDVLIKDSDEVYDLPDLKQIYNENKS